jgi:hypothetical protein
MRWYILKTLLAKEARRQLADRGGIFLALLLMAAALLLSFFGDTGKAGGTGVNAVRLYYVDFWEHDSPWIRHLATHLPADATLQFRYIHPSARGVMHYPQGTAAVQVRVQPEKDRSGRPRYLVMFWQPSKDPAEIAPLAEWFWRETQRYFRDQPIAIDTAGNAMIDTEVKSLVEIRPLGKDEEGRPVSRFVLRASGNNTDLFNQWLAKQSSGLQGEPRQFEVQYRDLGDSNDLRTMIATGLVTFAICFFCVYLLPAMTCEERERGILLAQALSPASTGEIFLAKFLFYPTLGLGLGAILAGIYNRAVLMRPFFWLSMVVLAVGYLGIGLTIASLARTQRRASMSALCYLLATALFALICQQNNIPFLIALEYHAPRMLNAALADKVMWYHWGNLAGALVLATIWTTVAAMLFRRRGWQ